MKNIVIILAAAIALLSSSCETDFDVTAEWKDVTIVYGLLNQNDSVHHIKINKAFLGEGNLIEYAGIQDSSTYQTKLDVTLKEVDNGNVLRTFSLDTTTVTNKEEGVFYHPEQIIYTTGEDNKVFLDDDYEYHLEIINPETGKEVTSQTYLVKAFSINKPMLNSPFYPTLHFPVNDNNKEVEWTSAKNGKLYQLVIYFSFTELTQQGDSIHRTIRWDKFADSRSIRSTGGETMRKVFKNNEFYDWLESEVPYSDPSLESEVDSRYSGALDFEVTVASDIFDTYMEVYKPSNSLIEYTPDFTNIENGIGLFSSRYQKTRSFYLQKATRVNLANLIDAKFTDPNTE